MNIPKAYHSTIKGLNVNSHVAEIDYLPWKRFFSRDKAVLGIISRIELSMGRTVRRSDVVNFYRLAVPPLEHFIAAMIWGHAAPPNGRRDNRGPDDNSTVAETSGRVKKARDVEI